MIKQGFTRDEAQTKYEEIKLINSRNINATDVASNNENNQAGA
jgi:hypothetical protein